MGKQWKLSDFIFLGSKITADGDWNHEIKRCLLLRRKGMTNWDSILKSRDVTLPTKVRLVKALAFPVVMYGCESWTVKKAERWGIGAFELWCWRRLLRVLGLQGEGPRTTKTFWNRTQLKTYMISKLARKLCNQDDGVLYKKRCTDQWNTRELKKNPTHT